MTWEEVKQEVVYKFAVGQIVEGRVKGIEPSAKFSESWLLTLADQKGDISKYWCNKVLKDKLEQAGGVGAIVRISHLGMAQAKNGNQYADFKVEKWTA